MYMKLEKQGNSMFHCKPQNDGMLYEEAYTQKDPQTQAGQEISGKRGSQFALSLTFMTPAEQ